METIKYVNHYCPESDMTFTTKETYINVNLVSIECIGFVFGESEQPYTGLKAEF